MEQPGYHRYCIWCAQPVNEDRWRRGAYTCSPECKAAESKAKRAHFNFLRREYLRPRILREARRAASAQGV